MLNRSFLAILFGLKDRPGYHVLWGLCLALLLPISAAQVEARELPDFTGIVQANSPAVVKINSVRKPQRRQAPDLQGREDVPELFRRFFEQRGAPRSPSQQSLGSGFVISDDGYVLTNHHVINGADEITVLFSDRGEFRAEVIGSDELSDLALLKIKGKDLPVVKIGRSADLDVGEWVLAIGSPFGLDYSVAAGIVSAKGRSLPTERNENYVPFIQTDVAINPGNSGGPLFNMDGEVVGINSQIYTRSGGSIGLSFAIPISVAMEVVDQLKGSGKVVRGWLGVGIQDVNIDLAESFGMDKPKGALVSQLVANGPAEKAGIRVGDVITSFNGKSIRESSELPHVVGRTAAGKKVPVIVFRDRRAKTLHVKVGALDRQGQKVASSSESPDDVEGGRLGLVVEELSDEQRDEIGGRGVSVRAIEPNSAAHQSGLRVGDVITLIDNKAVGSASAYKKIVGGLRKGRHVAVRIVRAGQPGFVAVKVD